MNKKILSIAALSMGLLMTSVMAVNAEPQCEKENMPKPPHGFAMQFEHKKPPFDAKKIAEFDKRLNLTAEQKATIEKNRKKSTKRLEAIRKQEMKLREEKHKILEQNRKDFEAVLTPEQKAELQKMHEERKQKMEEGRKQFEAKKKEFKNKQPKELK